MRKKGMSQYVIQLPTFLYIHQHFLGFTLLQKIIMLAFRARFTRKRYAGTKRSCTPKHSVLS